jgi:hypothetical protein
VHAHTQTARNQDVRRHLELTEINGVGDARRAYSEMKLSSVSRISTAPGRDSDRNRGSIIPSDRSRASTIAAWTVGFSYNAKPFFQRLDRLTTLCNLVWKGLLKGQFSGFDKGRTSPGNQARQKRRYRILMFRQDANRIPT